MTKVEEGTIKFDCRWQQAELTAPQAVQALNLNRVPLRRLGLIGADDEGRGYGNISLKISDAPEFLISGTGTSVLEEITESHLVKVTSFDFAANTVTCIGPCKPSSESLTHAAFYSASAGIGGVIHVHHELLWSKLRNVLPTTSAQASFGSVEFAQEVISLLQRTSPARTQFQGAGLIVAGGHRPGLFAFAPKLEDAVKMVVREYTLANVSGTR
jgi:L-ribulose-5-phosphate 4-epimerase